jgi:hypothetical protein
MIHTPKLDCILFDLLSQEAVRLLQHPNKPNKKNVYGRVIQDHVLGIKNATSAVINDRLSTFQQ